MNLILGRQRRRHFRWNDFFSTRNFKEFKQIDVNQYDVKVYILSQLKLTPILWNDGVSYSNFFSLFNDAPIVSLKNLLGYCLLCIQIAYQGSNAWLSNILYIYCTLCIVSRICELKHIFFRSGITRDYENASRKAF